MSDDLVTIARFELSHEGHLVRMRLAAAGIDAFVVGDHARQVFAMEIGGQIRVQVRDSDVDAAMEALSVDDLNGEDQGIPLEELEALALATSDPDVEVEPKQPEPYDAPSPPARIERYHPPQHTGWHGELRCPSCGAGNVRPRRLSSGQMLLSLLALGIPLLLVQGQMECEICKHRWKD